MRYMQIFDVPALAIVEQKEIPEASTIRFKGIFINTLEGHIQHYMSNLMEILSACQDISNKKYSGPVILTPQAAEALLQRANYRLEQGKQKIMEWEPNDNKLSILLPYAYIETKLIRNEHDPKGDDITVIDTTKTRAFVDGLMFTIW